MTNISQCIQDLQAADTAVRAAAAESLCLAGEAASGAATALVQACGDVEAVREWASAAVENLGPPPADQLPELRTLVSDADPSVAYWAITLCGRLQTAATSCEGELIHVLTSSPDAAVQERAAWALGKIHSTSPAAITALRGATESSSPRLARLAQTALDGVAG